MLLTVVCIRLFGFNTKAQIWHTSFFISQLSCALQQTSILQHLWDDHQLAEMKSFSRKQNIRAKTIVTQGWHSSPRGPYVLTSPQSFWAHLCLIKAERWTTGTVHCAAPQNGCGPRALKNQCFYWSIIWELSGWVSTLAFVDIRSKWFYSGSIQYDQRWLQQE